MKVDCQLLLMLLTMLLGYVFIHDLLGGTLFSHSAWDSYTLQALAWRRGEIGLGQNYSWLELAVFQGNWYVSFPPLPSVVMLPLTFLFGANTPNNFIVMLYALFTAFAAYKALLKMGTERRFAAFAALFLVWGSNMMWMSTSGGVWFQAQALNLLLLTCMVWAALCSKGVIAYALVALAVGCRPFSACAFLPLAVYFYVRDRERYSIKKCLLLQLKRILIPAVIAGVYMWYNYIRFGSVLEFGHNYLPEFTGAQYGQFNLHYIWANLKNLFLRPVTITANGALKYPYFDGFLFYVANPIFLIWFVRIVQDLIKGRITWVKGALIAAFVLELLLLCAHKTLGGWQFGARYTVDMIPFAFLYLLLDGWQGRDWQRVVMVFGIMFNVYGALAMTFLYL